MVVQLLENLRSLFQSTLFAFTHISITDVLDILLVTFIVYRVMLMVHSTSTARVAKAIILFLFATWVTSLCEMYMLNFILSRILELGFIALVIMFQPELRRALERFGGKSVLELVSGKTSPKSSTEEAILATVSACEIMSKEKVGVLLVFERETPLDEYFKTGTLIDAKTTEQLLRNLFFPKASLHDGAVIIRNGRVAAAGCVMPLSENPHLSSDLGTRHRAGIGTSEASDAVVVIVSEETGTISVAIGGMLKRHLAPQTLEKLLMNELVPNVDEPKTLVGRLKLLLTKKDRSNAKK